MPPETTAATEPTVIVRTDGRVGHLTLNRPKALNALDLPMIHTIAAALEAWRDDPAVHAVVLDAAGERAFCAGGDIRALRNQAIAGEHAQIESFFVEEYALNRVIARYPKPYISLIDGICMGGGIGLSVHGTVRVTTEHAAFAMPETQIGFFPDVGATFVLPRLRGAFGMYLALTSEKIGGADAVWLGLATHFVPRERLAGLASGLAEHGIAALAEAALPPPPAELRNLEPAVAAFAAPSVAEILAALERMGTEWSRATLRTLHAVSPSSLLWTFEIVRAGAWRTFEQCQEAELALALRATKHPDFAEGVRAMVVDKDRAPLVARPAGGCGRRLHRRGLAGGDEALQPVDRVVAGAEFGRFHDAAVQRQRRADALDRELGQRAAHPRDGLGARRRVDDQLGDHAVVIGRHDIAGVQRAIDAHAEAARRLVYGRPGPASARTSPGPRR